MQTPWYMLLMSVELQTQKVLLESVLCDEMFRIADAPGFQERPLEDTIHRRILCG